MQLDLMRKTVTPKIIASARFSGKSKHEKQTSLTGNDYSLVKNDTALLHAQVSSHNHDALQTHKPGEPQKR